MMQNPAVKDKSKVQFGIFLTKFLSSLPNVTNTNLTWRILLDCFLLNLLTLPRLVLGVHVPVFQSVLPLPALCILLRV